VRPMNGANEHLAVAAEAAAARPAAARVAAAVPEALQHEVAEWVALQQHEQHRMMREAAEAYTSLLASTDKVLASLPCSAAAEAAAEVLHADEMPTDCFASTVAARFDARPAKARAEPHLLSPARCIPPIYPAIDRRHGPNVHSAAPSSALNTPAIDRAVAARRRREAAASPSGGCTAVSPVSVAVNPDPINRRGCSCPPPSPSPPHASLHPSCLPLLPAHHCLLATHAAFRRLFQPTLLSRTTRRHRLRSAIQQWRNARSRTSHPLAASHLSKRAALIALRRGLQRWHSRAVAATAQRAHAARQCRVAALAAAARKWRRRARARAAWRRELQLRMTRWGILGVHLPCMAQFDARRLFLSEGNAVMATAYRRRRMLAVVMCAWWAVAVRPDGAETRQCGATANSCRCQGKGMCDLKQKQPDGAKSGDGVGCGYVYRELCGVRPGHAGRGRGVGEGGGQVRRAEEAGDEADGDGGWRRGDEGREGGGGARGRA
jgi:uncharacterized membrane protein YbaN (DUF454 family)